MALKPVTDPSVLRALNGEGGAPSPTLPRPVLTVPNTDMQHDNANQDRQTQISGESLDVSRRNSDREAHSSQINNANSLATRFDGLPPVREYRAVVPIVTAAMKAPDDGSGDTSLLYAFAKVNDPGSVVREGEVAMGQSGGSVFDNKVAELKKQFGIEGGGNLSPEVRLRIRREMDRKLQEMQRSYDLQRTRFTDDANAYGIDPARVIGPHDFSPYAADYVATRDKLLNGQPGAAGNPLDNNPGMPMRPTGGPFDRADWVKKNLGLDANQEASVVSFWNANRGNAGLTPEAVRGFYQQIGAPAPTDADIASGIASARKGVKFSPFDTSQAEAAYKKQLEGIQQGQDSYDPKGTFGAANRLGNSLMFGLGDEAQGVQRAAGAALMGQDPIANYKLGRDAARLTLEQTQQAQPGMSTAADLLGGFGGALLMPGSIGAGAGGVAKAGALAGGLSGFGNGEGLPGSLTGAAIGTGMGAGLGYAGGKVGDALAARSAGRSAAPLSDGGQVIQAADNLNGQFGTNIQPMPADVGGITTRRATGGMAQLPLAAQPIVSGAQKVTAEAAKARDAIALLAGNPAQIEGAGEAALSGARNFIKTSRARVSALYAKARSLGGDQPVDLAEARNVLDQNIAELLQVPGGGAGLDRLKALRAELDKPYPVEGVRQMRTQLRDQFMGDGLRGSDLERRVGQVLDAADSDITNGLNQAGKGDAARAYAEAAAAHKERLGVIDNILAPIIGSKADAPKSGEEIMAAISRATQTNNKRLGGFLAALPAEDAGTVRATLISRLGQASKGTQDAEGTAFSLPQFLTHWNAMTPEAKSTLFGGELRAALDNLAKVADGTKQAQKFANFSNTGSPIGMVATGAGSAGFFAAPITTTAAMAAQYGGGLLLSSPKFARWLANMPSNPNAVSSHIKALSRIAANDNAISGPVRELAQHLEQSLGILPQKSAAGDQKGGVPIPSPSAGTAKTEGPGQ